MEPNPYLSRRVPHSESTMLNDLYALNRHFVTLLLSGTGSDGLLAGHLLTALTTLSDEQLERLASCPYSLFDLALDDARLWRERVARYRVQPASDSEISAAHCPRRGAFALAALLYARQLASLWPDLARLLLGMHNDVARALGELPLTALTAEAYAPTPLLRARLHRHPHFWPDLIDFVRGGTQERFLAAQTVGVQQSARRFR